MFPRTRTHRLQDGSERRRRDAVAVALLVGVLAASGCSAQDAEEPKPSAPAGARSLDQHQLEAARLTKPEATEYVSATGGFGSTLSEEKKAQFLPVLKDELISKQVTKVEAALKAAS
ncbi:hypothetical protein [Streptomyces sp. NPDC127119]|uniref:hypothetical protein n=1 Tax=Streptomyces sp. NPDC127119 TaxID=3345370 RepID=UPI00362E1502